MNRDQLMAILSNEDQLAGFAAVDTATQEALLGAIMQLPAGEKAKALARIMKPKVTGTKDATSRSEVMARLGQITDKDVVKALAEGRAQISDARYYWMVVANAVTSVEVILDSQTVATGVTNLNNGKFNTKNWFLLTGIVLLSGVNATLAATAFDTIATTIANGTFEFRANGGKYMLPKDSSCQVFDTSNRTDIENGLYKLDNPKWLAPDNKIDFNLKFPAATAANTNLKLMFVGAEIISF